MPLTRSAGRRTLAQKSNQNSRRNPSRQSTARASRAGTRSNALPSSTTSGRGRRVFDSLPESDSEASPSDASESSWTSDQAPESPSRRRRSTRIAAGHGDRTGNRVQRPSRSARVPQNLPSRKRGDKPKDKPKGKGRPATASNSPSKRRQMATQSKGEDETPLVSGPDWTDPRIPYQFWVEVFLYARDNGGADPPNTHWLLQVATSCKALSEPALTAIYRCPTIRHASKARRLASLLERCPMETRFNYRRKIEFLHIDIHIVPQGIISQLVRPLTRLKELIFYTPMDQPPYRELDAHIRWNYSEDIFLALASPSDDSLAEQPALISLKSWEWSGRLLGGYVANINDIVQVHQSPSFAHLTRLSFTNFQVPSLRGLQQRSENDEDDLQSTLEDNAAIDAMADAIAQLKYLKHLVFESSTIMTDRLLPLLPKDLTHLELINCWEIKSEDLAAFLLTHGNGLRALTLLHNQSLNLAFLPILEEACPNLRELRMNMSYFRHHDSLNDADPMYDFVLLPYQVPTWPASIRLIDIEHIRNWTVETAKMFIQSLVDNAGNMQNLRHLVIKTMLDIPWQARATLRSNIRPMVERVFLRKVESPQVDTTIQQTDGTHEPTRSRKRKRTPSSTSPFRRSGRIEAHPHDSPRRSRRDNKSQRGQLGKSMYRVPDTDEDESGISEEESDSEVSNVQRSPAADEPSIQGLCNTVNIVFDNQKVRELQYSMEDFLADDDESSGEEWDGDDDQYDDNTIAF
ncbi:uncharacterized protein TRIVIDRAFT_231511 [Trichoderma virens Gv29-8]|uniref:Uncharacterized protein n=1 Tax=Hypocrea virens (strain Gv29-8 / FGSC 10586) TaxID=413071 RepID=G9N2Y3_HYPVG|nr:uncharacterized protein TRIVIDRAFT_231511 [Trichoderma virens Gv29-8]EHK18668.1 hypothetical protein TRIVIDRAFT_231511 [Trichoderma virens Gv29-8]UKZ56448.1 hypothetical protein TrVGV298_010284 [Trichoderma virens]